MKNILGYYYSLHPSEIYHKDDKYFFEYLDNNYVLEPFKRPLNDVDALYNVNTQMKKKDLLIHEIIINNENKILTYINNVPYILLEIFINPKSRIMLLDICHINNSTTELQVSNVLNRTDWTNLWEMKNDYFESQISELSKKHPVLCNYANYYIGLAENAIAYVRNANKIDDNTLTCICHKRISTSDTVYSLYNPTEFVYDYRIRDACEYIKSAFFNDEDAYSLIEEYFKYNSLSYKEALLFYGRLLYPSYFFDIYDEIVNKDLDDNIIENIIIKSDAYEKFLLEVYILFTKLYNRYIPGIDWIIKRSSY